MHCPAEIEFLKLPAEILHFFLHSWENYGWEFLKAVKIKLIHKA